ncbi:hypothetical protein GPN29_004791 [Salmonella enterica]|nr:hypothetical protein [Salmonella enterica]
MMLVRGAEPMENRQRRSLFFSSPSSLIVCALMTLSPPLAAAERPSAASQ